MTVLLAVLKDSMDLMVDRNPGKARNLLDLVVDRMIKFIHHYEGRVKSQIRSRQNYMLIIQKHYAILISISRRQIGIPDLARK